MFLLTNSSDSTVTNRQKLGPSPITKHQTRTTAGPGTATTSTAPTAAFTSPAFTSTSASTVTSSRVHHSHNARNINNSSNSSTRQVSSTSRNSYSHSGSVNSLSRSPTTTTTRTSFSGPPTSTLSVPGSHNPALVTIRSSNLNVNDDQSTNSNQSKSKLNQSTNAELIDLLRATNFNVTLFEQVLRSQANLNQFNPHNLERLTQEFAVSAKNLLKDVASQNSTSHVTVNVATPAAAVGVGGTTYNLPVPTVNGATVNNHSSNNFSNTVTASMPRPRPNLEFIRELSMSQEEKTTEMKKWIMQPRVNNSSNKSNGGSNLCRNGNASGTGGVINLAAQIWGSMTGNKSNSNTTSSTSSSRKNSATATSNTNFFNFMSTSGGSSASSTTSTSSYPSLYVDYHRSPVGLNLPSPTIDVSNISNKKTSIPNSLNFTSTNTNKNFKNKLNFSIPGLPDSMNLDNNLVPPALIGSSSRTSINNNSTHHVILSQNSISNLATINEENDNTSVAITDDINGNSREITKDEENLDNVAQESVLDPDKHNINSNPPENVEINNSNSNLVINTNIVESLSNNNSPLTATILPILRPGEDFDNITMNDRYRNNVANHNLNSSASSTTTILNNLSPSSLNIAVAGHKQNQNAMVTSMNTQLTNTSNSSGYSNYSSGHYSSGNSSTSSNQNSPTSTFGSLQVLRDAPVVYGSNDEQNFNQHHQNLNPISINSAYNNTIVRDGLNSIISSSVIVRPDGNLVDDIAQEIEEQLNIVAQDSNNLTLQASSDSGQIPLVKSNSMSSSSNTVNLCLSTTSQTQLQGLLILEQTARTLSADRLCSQASQSICSDDCRSEAAQSDIMNHNYSNGIDSYKTVAQQQHMSINAITRSVPTQCSSTNSSSKRSPRTVSLSLRQSLLSNNNSTPSPKNAVAMSNHMNRNEPLQIIVSALGSFRKVVSRSGSENATNTINNVTVNDSENLSTSTTVLNTTSTSIEDLPDELLHYISQFLSYSEQFDFSIAAGHPKRLPQIWGVTAVFYCRYLTDLQSLCEKQGILTDIASENQRQAQRHWLQAVDLRDKRIEDRELMMNDPVRFDFELQEAVENEQRSMMQFQATVSILQVVMGRWAELCASRDVAVRANRSLKNAIRIVFGLKRLIDNSVGSNLNSNHINILGSESANNVGSIAPYKGINSEVVNHSGVNSIENLLN